MAGKTGVPILPRRTKERRKMTVKRYRCSAVVRGYKVSKIVSASTATRARDRFAELFKTVAHNITVVPYGASHKTKNAPRLNEGR